MALASALHHSADKTTRAHGDRRTQVPSTTSFLTMTWCLRLVFGHPVWVSRGGHSRRSSGTSWSISLLLSPWCKLSMLMCRRRGEKLVHFFKELGAHPPVEQVIDVPKISQDRTQQRLVDYLRPPQMAEQLVEVPTLSSLQQFRLVVGVFFKDFSQNRIQQRLVEQITLIPQFREVAFSTFSLILVLHPQFRSMSWGKGFLALFPDLKKARRRTGR